MSATGTERARNVLIVGVGGQGVIMVSKVLARVCQLQGFQVKQSEVHGMAKRGGAVFSHVRYGAQVWSPTIPRGEADVLLAMEWAEGLRWLNYLHRDGGTFIADTRKIVPPFACRNRKRGAAVAYSPEAPAEVIDKVSRGFALDATDMADAVGNRRAANSVLLGALSTALEFPEADWRMVLAEAVPPGTVEANLRAFAAGRAWMQEAQADPVAALPPAYAAAPPAAVVEATDTIRLEIIEAWCKGCDICVKICPERCLALNSRQVAELTVPEACTGCRICEWLCPDLAIKVELQPVPAVSA